MKSLVIAEKPSVGRDIARVLKCSKQGNGMLEGQNYIITWGLGHLVSLADPEQYDKRFKEWKMEDLPMIPDKFRLEVLRQTGKQFQVVKQLIHRNDVSEIIIATDAGREGELVARLILEKVGNKKPLKRLWISSVTDKAIRDGFGGLKNAKEYNNLYDAALCRAQADWLVGMNATRALTCKYNAQLSCGRVQTPTVALIAKREEEIKKFTPVPFYGITAKQKELKVALTWYDKKSKNSHCFELHKVNDILSKLNGKTGIVDNIETKEKKTPPPQLFDLTELQREANKRFDYSAKYTLGILQRLYENHKVLTYPRTDSRYLSKDIVPTLKERLKSISIGPYKTLAGKLINQKLEAKSHFVNDSKVSDHHAIIPTEQYVQLDHMTVEERKIYDLVIRRFIAVLYPAFVYQQVKLEVLVEGELFTAKAKAILQLGWKELYAQVDSVEDDHTYTVQFPDWKKGHVLSGIQLNLTEGKTSAPSHYNEGTLLTAMEQGGLGTVATRADVIEKLFGSFLLEKKGKDIYTTAKAKQLLELVPVELRSPDLTASWESKLLKITSGELKKQEFMKGIVLYTQEVVNQIKVAQGQFRHDNLTNSKCPNCGKRMLSVKGKTSELLVCQDRLCGHREVLSKTTNARCPNCHKKLNLKGKGDGQIFVCGCGHKEKLSSFQDRRKKEGAGVSKKDIQNYLNKHKKETQEPINNAFSALLSEIKLEDS